MQYLRTFVLTFLLASGFAPSVRAQPDTPAPTPARVTLRDPQNNKNDAAAKIARKLRLEAGADVLPTAGLTSGEASRNREKYLLLATQAVEGGYDAVNIYDRGILSWGLMQWAAHSNSLQDALWYIKDRLIRKGKGRVWANLFKEQGLDVQAGPGGVPAFFVGGPDAWKPVVGIDALRVLFRGTAKVGRYDAPTVTRWGRVFARAGRNPTVQALQVEWATKRLRDCLGERIDARWSVAAFSRGDLFSDALTFALWTNNPAAFREHYRRAVRQTRKVTGEADPANWPPGLFPLLWEQVARASTFGVWSKRAATVAKLVPVGSVGRKRASTELASRGWSLEDLRRGRGGGRPWRREAAKPAPPVKPASPVKPAAAPKTAAAAQKPVVTPRPPRMTVVPTAPVPELPETSLPADETKKAYGPIGNSGGDTGGIPRRPGGG